MNTILIVCLAPYIFLSAGCSYTTIKTKQHQVVFRYPEQRRSEKDLPICELNSVCSVLHKRYWLPPVADRLCRCVNNDECSWRWSDDNRTMILNNRSQFKFCAPITHLSPCTPQQTALVTNKTESISVKQQFKINLHCYCPARHQWTHFKTKEHIYHISGSKTIEEEFKCKSLRRCHSLEFCGNVRSDYNSIYYKCVCPPRHLCINKNTIKMEVEELLYTGTVYRAVCDPEEPNGDYDYRDY